MGSSVNRNLQRKYEISLVQKRDAVRAEFSKPAYNMPKPVIPTYDHAMVRRFHDCVSGRGKGMAKIFRQHF